MSAARHTTRHFSGSAVSAIVSSKNQAGEMRKTTIARVTVSIPMSRVPLITRDR